MPSRLQVSIHIEEWMPKVPFRITGLSLEVFKMLVVELTDGHHVGRGEAAPVFYLNETVDSMYREVEAIARQIERGIDRHFLLQLMVPGGARKAVDCALWDFDAKRLGKTVWDLTGIAPKPVTTVFTIGIEETPEAMAARAIEAAIYPILKIKVDNDRPAERVAAIRAARPDAKLVVDANQGWSFDQLIEVTPKLEEMGVKLIEQPLPRGKDEPLEGYASSIPLSADESCQHRGELDQAARRYQIINIKLEKAGGLTEALLLVQAVHEKGLTPLTGCMWGTSLAMAPALVLAQLCQYVEVDGQLLLKHDRFPSLPCHNGEISVPDRRLWG